MKDEILNLNVHREEKRQTSNKEEKCEEEGNLTEEFEAQASVFYQVCIYGCKFCYAVIGNINP